MPSDILYRKQIDSTVDQIESIDARAHEIWEGRGNYGSVKQSKINLRLMEQKIRPLDLLRESLFKKLWALHEQTDFEFSDIDEISSEKRFNGRNEVTRITYCDGVFHYATSKKGKFQYGYVCTC